MQPLDPQQNVEPSANHKNIAIIGTSIRLDQLLKLATILPTGGQIRFLLDDDAILVNGEKVTEKRKKIHVGDIVTIRDWGTLSVFEA